MSKHLSQVLDAFREGAGLIGVQDDDISGYLKSFHSADPAGGESPRTLILWDAADGFLPPADFPDALPAETDLTLALEFVLGFRNSAVFLLDCRGWDWSAVDARLRKLLKQLGLKLGSGQSVLALLVASEPLAAPLIERITWIGAPPAPGTDKGGASDGSSKLATGQSAEDYSDFRSLVRFDTPEWERRIDKLTPEEVDRVIQSGAYKDSLDRVRELRDALKKRFARKDEIVDAICAATVAQVPTVLIGPPGTAKSNIIRCLCEGLGLTAQVDSDGERHVPGGGEAPRRYFEYLLTRYTTPEEIFGPIHVQDLIDRQTYRRVTAGYLPQAHVSFLDEIFKASSAILNTLLSLLNERIFYNGGLVERVPLMMVFAASNEAPVEDNLKALYDRFPLRLNCPSVPDAHVEDLLSASWQQAYDRQFSTRQLSLPKIACTNDLRLLRHVARVRFGGREIGQRSQTRFDFKLEFLRFFRSLRSDFAISDRTLALLLAFCRAQATLNGQTELTAAELDVFKYVSWDGSGTGELDRLVTNMKRGIRI